MELSNSREMLGQRAEELAQLEQELKALQIEGDRRGRKRRKTELEALARRMQEWGRMRPPALRARGHRRAARR